MARTQIEAPRRRGGEVHRRCGRRGLRGARRPRGRPRARGARGPADRRGRRGARPSVGGAPLQPPRRHQHRRGPGPSRGAAPPRARGSSPGTRSTPPRGSSRSPPRWAWRSVSGPTRPPRRSSTTRSSNRRRSRASPSRCASSTPRAPRARFGTDLTRTHDTPFIGREIDLALLKGIFDKTRGRGLPPARHGRRGAGPRQEPDRRRAVRLHRHQARAHHLAAGAVSPLRRGHHVLGAGRDPEGPRRHPGVRRTRGRDLQARRRSFPKGTSAPGSASACCRCSGSRRPPPPSARSCSPPGDGSSNTSPSRTPPCSCSRTCTGPTTRCSRSSSTSPTGPRRVPLLIVGTARPELFERHPDYANGLRNATTINLAPLSEEETARLVSALLETTVIPAELQQPILDRAGGNPLYAEEFVRLLKDKDLLVKKGASWELREGAEVPFPDSVQALIAARLDTLSADTKSMLADAAVVGQGLLGRGDRRRWASVTSPRSPRRSGSSRARSSCVRPGVPRSRARPNTPSGTSWPATSPTGSSREPPEPRVTSPRRDGSSPRPRNGSRTSPTSSPTTTRPRSSSLGPPDRPSRPSELEAPALKFLSLAGERALGLDTAAALSNLERALALAPEGHPERPEALARFGEAAFQAGRYAEAAEALGGGDRVVPRQRAIVPAAARAMGTLGMVFSALGDPRAWTLPAEALALLEPLGPSPELVGALTEVAAVDALQGRSEDGDPRTPSGRSALAEELGLPRPARALGCRAIARADLGDPGGLEDFREAIVLATEAGQGREVAVLHNNLGMRPLVVRRSCGVPRGPARGDRLRESAGAHRDARRPHRRARSIRSSIPASSTRRSTSRPRSIPRLEASGDVWDLVAVRAAQTRIFALRGRAARGQPSVLDWLEPTVRGTRRTRRTSSWAWARPLPSRAPRSARTKPRRRSSPRSRRPPAFACSLYYPVFLPAMVRTALGIGERRRSPSVSSRGLEPRYPLRRARPRRGERRPHRGPRGPAGRRRCLRRCRRSLGAVRGRPRAGVRAPRSGPVSDRARPDRPRPLPSCSTPARSSSGSRRPPRSPRPTRSFRRPRRSARSGDGGQHLVKEPTEPKRESPVLP